MTYRPNPWSGNPGVHASQHQRRDRATGGVDPLDIYNRALVNLRGRAQATPNMTCHVERGFYSLNGYGYYAGGDSAAFAAPTDPSMWRYDLLYLNSAGALVILSGTEIATTGTPTYPTPPADSLPIIYVTLEYGQTTITEADIADARVILTAVITGRASIYSSTLTGGATSEVVTHNLGTRDVVARVYQLGSPYSEIFCIIEHTTINTVTVRMAASIPASTYRIVIIGG